MINQGETSSLEHHGKKTVGLFLAVRWVASIREKHFAVVISKMQTDGGHEEDLLPSRLGWDYSWIWIALQTGSMQTRDNHPESFCRTTELIWSEALKGWRAAGPDPDTETGRWRAGAAGGRDQWIKGSDCDFVGQVNGWILIWGCALADKVSYLPSFAAIGAQRKRILRSSSWLTRRSSQIHPWVQQRRGRTPVPPSGPSVPLTPPLSLTLPSASLLSFSPRAGILHLQCLGGGVEAIKRQQTNTPGRQTSLNAAGGTHSTVGLMRCCFIETEPRSPRRTRWAHARKCRY